MAHVLLIFYPLTCRYSEFYHRYLTPPLTSFPKPDDFQAVNFGDAASRAVSARFFANDVDEEFSR